MAAPYLANLDGFPSTGLDGPVTPGGEGLSSRRTNALSTKLTSVLSSSYADYEIRGALRLLDERGVQNDEETRRNLKWNAQKEVIDANAKIVDDFGQVAEQLQRVGAMLTTLNQTVTSMRTHILAAKQESTPVLDEASTLIARKEETETKASLLAAFTAHFLISNADLTILTSSAEPLDERFFTILARVKQIHHDCEILLGYNSENQRLGLELMEQTTRNLDAGFKKLYTWIQREFKTLDLEDPHISGSIRHALRVLSERPTLFQNCLDFFADARQSTLAEAFHAALTGSAGAAAAAAKAIEFSTHEPLRYVGDMLAWVHSAAVSEKEALEGLFISDADEISRGLSAGKTSEPWARISRARRTSVLSTSSHSSSTSDPEQSEEPVFDGRKALSDLISRNLSSVGQTLSSRIDISVRTAGDPVLMFKIFNLLDFYRGIFAKLLGSESGLSELIQSLQSSTLVQFEKSMEAEIAAATGASETEPTEGLTPPAFLATALTQFSEVCRARGPPLTEAELERLFSAMLRGVLIGCAEAAGQIADTVRNAIYKINYMTVLRATLASTSKQVPIVQIPLEKAALEIQSLRDGLVEEVSSRLLDESGVRELMTEIDAWRSHGAKKRREWLSANLDEAAQRLDEFLSSALMDVQEGLKSLLDRAVARDVVNEAVERFCSEFEELESMLEVADAERENAGQGETKTGDASEQNKSDETNSQIGSLRELYPRTGAEVRALLS